MPIWLILHQRIADGLSFLYFIYMIILTLKFIICVIFFSVIVMIHLDPQEYSRQQYARERLIDQEQTPPGTQLTENNI